MGGRIGARLESLPRREDDDVFVGGDTLRQPLEMAGNDDKEPDDPPAEDGIQQIKQNMNQVSREPEREPYMEEQKVSG
jgi:hypothetical protein